MIRTVRTRRGARLVQDDAVLSELLRRPGPTHCFWDVLAAAVVGFSAGPRFLMLGFAAGGIVAPLRAAGWEHPVEAVDLSTDGLDLFEEMTDGWGGDVTVHRGEAVDWTRRRRRRYDVVLEDLSIPGPAGVTKPAATAEPLPALIARRLAPGGVALINLLPVPGWTWKALLPAAARPWRQALVIGCHEYQNRILVAGDRLPTARAAGARLRGTLRALGSRMHEQVTVRTLRPSGR